ncbi:MAG: hypothetical protein OXG41_01180 [Acidimicrobiaceae bacterium]|nr:hypothetical protein [Acidimicrobiaceae bacterium]
MRTLRGSSRLLARATAAAAVAAAVLVIAASPAAADLAGWADERTARAGDLADELARCDAWIDAQDWQQWFDNTCEETLGAAVRNSGATDAWLPEGGGARTTPGWSISRYSIYYDGGGYTAWHRKMTGAATSWIWTAATYALRMAVWAMDWVAAGRITDVIGVIPIEVGDFLHREIVVGLQLRHLALTVMGVVSAWAIMRRRIAEAVGNMAFAVAALALGAFVLANLAGYYDGARATKALLVEAVLGDDTGGELDAAAMTAPLLDGVVHTPWENLNFGRGLAGDCEIAAGVDILERAPSPDDHYPRHRIKDCPDGRALDTFNRYPTASRLFGALIVAFGQMAVAGLILATALIGLTSELLLAAAFASLPVVAVVVAFPGGRSVAASWLSMLLRGIVGLAAGVLGLRLVVVVMTAVATNSEDLAFFERFAVFSLVAFAGWRMRKLIPQAAAKISATLGGKAAAAGSGRSGAGAALAAGAAGGAVGGLAAGAAASQLIPAHSVGTAARTARRAASGTLRTGRAAGRGATGLAAVAAQSSGREGAATRVLSATKAGQRAAYGGGLAAAAAAGVGHAIARRNDTARAASASLDQDALHDLAHGPSRRGQLIAMRHPDTAQADIDHVAINSIDKKVVKAAAPRTSPEVAHELAASPSRAVRAAAASGALAPHSAHQMVTRGRTRGPYQPPPGETPTPATPASPTAETDQRQPTRRQDPPPPTQAPQPDPPATPSPQTPAGPHSEPPVAEPAPEPEPAPPGSVRRPEPPTPAPAAGPEPRHEPAPEPAPTEPAETVPPESGPPEPDRETTP